jgi:archaellum component FlaF (FlaF/FlaG flagellin family)
LNKNAIVLASVSAAIAVISVMLLLSIFSLATKNFALDVDPIKDNQNLFNTARVTVTNTGKLTLNNIPVIYDEKSTERINSLPPGQKIMLSPPNNSSLKSVTVIADHGLKVTRTYRTPLKIPGMMGS